MTAELVALHMGALHPYETVLALVLAFGPFVVLGAVVAVRRRHDRDAAQEAQQLQETDEVDERASR